MTIVDSLYITLVQKNLITEMRLWRRFLREVFVLLIILVIVVTNPIQKSTHYRLNLTAKENVTRLPVESINSFENFRKILNIKGTRLPFQLAYTPDTEFTRILMTEVSRNMKLDEPIGFEDSKKMKDNFNSKTMLAGVVFEDLANDADDLPMFLSFSLRFPSTFRTLKQSPLQDELWSTRCSGVIDNINDNDPFLQRNIYVSEGFLQLQNELFSVWLSKHLNKLNTEDEDGDYDKPIETGNVQYTRFSVLLLPFRPRNSYVVCQYSGVTSIYIFLFWFLFLISFCNLIWTMAREREENIMVHHWQYGCTYKKHWLSHFLVAMLHFIILDFLIIAIIKMPFFFKSTGGTFIYTNTGIILIFLLVYNVALIVAAITIVIINVNPTRSVLFGIIWWLVNFVLFFSVLMYDRDLKMQYVYACIIFFFNNSFAYSMHLLKYHLHESYEKIWYIMLALLGNILVHSLLLVFIQSRLPGRYFNSKAIDLFNIRKKYFTKLKLMTTHMDFPAPPLESYEFGPIGSKMNLRMLNVTTCYKKKGADKRSLQHLKNITISMFQGEITVLLGHHGAGKTTFIRTLAGWNKPSIGYVYYFNRNLYEYYYILSKFSDVMMPNNALFDFLTVRETLTHFVRIKGERMSAKTRNAEIVKWLNLLKPFIDNEKAVVHRLSFEQKRLICLCCTLACDTKIILLDEPTLHMRPLEKLHFWKILKREKKNRIIVTTTFCCDEAEQIGDRIAIINTGVIMAYGTILYLKIKFSKRNELVILKEPNASTEDITNLIQTIHPDIVPAYETAKQVTYKIPIKLHLKYRMLLIKLETNAKQLGIQKIYFLTPDFSEYYMDIDLMGKQSPKKQILPTSKNYTPAVLLEPKYMNRYQFRGVLFKKVLQQTANILPVFTTIISIAFIVLIGYMLHSFENPNRFSNPIELGISKHLRKRTGFEDVVQENCGYIEVPPLKAKHLYEHMYATSREVEETKLECQNGHLTQVVGRSDIGVQNGMITLKFIPQDAYYRCLLWINQREFHSAPVSLNLLHNILLQHIFPNSPELVVSTRNDPFEPSIKERLIIVRYQLRYIELSIAVGVIFPIIIASFIMSMVKDRNHNMLTLLKLTNVKNTPYWSATFVWDFFAAAAYCLIFIVALSFVTMHTFELKHKLYIFIMLLFNFINELCLVYIIAMFRHRSKLQACYEIILIQLFFGVFMFIYYLEVTELSHVFYYAFVLFPPFVTLDALSQIYLRKREMELCKEQCELIENCSMKYVCHFLRDCCSKNMFRWDDPGLLKSTVFSLISTAILLIVLLTIHARRKQLKFVTPKSVKKCRSVCYSFDDPKVIELRKQIASFNMAQCLQTAVCVDQLEKAVPKNSKRIATISFVVDKNTCVCIYGSHHSGKTHLGKQLIGEIGLQFGEIYINGLDLKTQLSQIRAIVGFCPQSHGYYTKVHVSSMLRLMYVLRGVPEQYVSAKIRELSQMLNIRHILTLRLECLTPADKRKVNIAISLIACNKVFIFDEPTRGMPAETRMEIWNVIRFLRSIGSAVIVLTSDSLECKELADEVLLFDNNEILAVENLHVLRDLHAKGFVLDLKLKCDGSTDEIVQENLKRDVENCNRFAGFLSDESVLLQQSNFCLKFYIPVEHFRYSFLYGEIEAHKFRLNIANYTISHISLDQILYNILKLRAVQKAEHAKVRKETKRSFLVSSL